MGARDGDDAVAARANVVTGMDDRTAATDRHVDFARSELWPRPDRDAVRINRKATGLGFIGVAVSAVHHQAFEAALLDRTLQHLEAAKAPVAEPLRIDDQDVPRPDVDQRLLDREIVTRRTLCRRRRTNQSNRGFKDRA